MQANKSMSSKRNIYLKGKANQILNEQIKLKSYLIFY